jgi:hypothetical protein
MAGQAGNGNGQGGLPGPDPRPPQGGPVRRDPVRRDPGTPESALGRDARLAGFAAGGQWADRPPSAPLAAALEAACGPGWECAGATREELFGLLRQWQAQESRAAAGKLAVLRALIRDDDTPLPGGGYRGDLPEGWTKSLTHEVALALSMPVVSADQLMWLAWDLEGRLPGTGALLAGGKLTTAKAKAVDDALQSLSAEDAATAEAMILSDLPGKTYGQVEKLAVLAAFTVDPESATRRREEAERSRSRVEMFREQSGAAALAGRELPTDQALAANANVCARALEYRESGQFPDGTRMDQYRVAAFLDLLNGITADTRIAIGLLPGACPIGGEPAGKSPAHDEGPDGGPADGTPGSEGLHGGPADPDRFDEDSDGEAEPDDDAESDRDADPLDEERGRGRSAAAAAEPARLADLILPLMTLLGLADRPGEGHGLGPLDPDLCRALAAAAVGSHDSRLCITVTDADGIAIAHGCARTARHGKQPGLESTTPDGQPPRVGPLPARVNLTVTAARLAELARTTRPPGLASWAFTQDAETPTAAPGPPGRYGNWVLILPDGTSLTVALRPMPTYECDHRYESHAYQPNDTLRHMVQVRDGQCTFPTCSRHARESDFEHAIPYDKGGRTCACNAGARSRACHQVKQSAGWRVTQPKPGWHQWETPSGRTYIQGPKRYPT